MTHQTSSNSLPEHFVHLHVRNIDEIARDKGVSPAALPQVLKNEMHQWVQTLRQHPYASVGEHLPTLDMLYHLYNAAHHPDNQRDPSLQWLSSVRHFDTFTEHFCPAGMATSGELAQPRAKIADFVKRYLRSVAMPAQTMTLEDDGEGRFAPVKGSLLRQSQWSPLPATVAKDPEYLASWLQFRFYVSTPVLHEINELLDRPQFFEQHLGHRTTLFHGTGSEALKGLHGIGETQAISSAESLVSKNLPVATGEWFSERDNEGKPKTGGSGGLGDVYSSEGGIKEASYHVVRWFDEFPVTFCIDRQKQQDFNQQHNIRREYVNSGNEGILLGPTVPLANVKTIVAPKANEEAVLQWIACYCPEVPFISHEAATLADEHFSYLAKQKKPGGKHRPGSKHSA
ncbi:hypothetical protein QCD60_02450 [Pokkaliibacter sp. MBI-7]|uniref:hypothetical protein n=1 Tax=Pokkaliibacter sp. MBI-7 TaxID=3040600 RepID=UPI00244A115D|nr:hypothetical protein [Pokkaliibacter sp. MBI-7]MDH2431418.1 hypothetical protein [Pokkaliibacter sp. MBI-7]